MHPPTTTLPIVGSTDTLRSAMTIIQRSGRGIALAVDGTDRLVGVVTDGDARRAVLAGLDLDTPVRDRFPARLPIIAPADTDPTILAAMFREYGVRQIPLLDGDGRPAGLATVDDLLPESSPPPVQAVIMAGGYGTRLRPLTETCPKPMLPVGGRPLLEHTLERLRAAGIRRACITVHYQPERIIAHFGDGGDHGLDLHYLPEDRPLGTAGALANLTPDGPLLVVNGDLLTEVDYRALLAHHRAQGAELTLAVRRHEQSVPFGVVEVEGAAVRALTEKPTVGYLVNAGVYVVEPSVLGLIPAGQRYDMTDLIAALLAAGRPVAAFAVIESWRDIGTLESYRRAQEEAGS